MVFWTWLYFDKDGKKLDKDSDEVKDRIPYLRYYNVWHIDQCEGISTKVKQVEPNAELKPNEEAEKIILDYVTRECIKLRNDKHSDDAFYNPEKDEIVLPMLTQYAEQAEYYSTAFHELTHSTGHTKRLNRLTKTAAHGSDDFGKEELVAEVGSAMLCNHVGIDCEKAFRNSVAYLQNWLKAIKGDAKMIVFAAGQAEKATNYILNINKGQE